MHFNWAPANRIRGNLHLRTGVIGEFREKIEAGGDISISAARTFAKEYRDRSAIVGLAEKMANRIRGNLHLRTGVIVNSGRRSRRAATFPFPQPALSPRNTVTAAPSWPWPRRSTAALW